VVPPVTAGRRAGFLAVLAVLGVAVAVAAGLWPIVGPSLTQRAALPAASRSVDGVPVPASAQRCAMQDPWLRGSTRWCLPADVSAATVARWYDEVLPPGRDAPGLRWCVAGHLSDGSSRALWATGDGLVGYILPPERVRWNSRFGARVAVEVVRFPGLPCHPAARASREQP
jgi:hypothetical protein